ncbi:MAG TPA: response regulator transcription factor [Thermoanaerobaculia bacterium]
MLANDSKRRITVCVLSQHPLLLSEFERLLPESQFRVLSRRMDAEAGVDLSSVTIPRASVYVVEAHRRMERTEELAGAVAAQRPGCRVIVLGERFDESSAFPLLRLGIKGLLAFSQAEAQLARAIRVVAADGFWVPRALLSRFVENTLKAPKRTTPLPSARRLSRRERQVLDLLLQNLSNKEIAKELQISARTAKFHVSNLLSKHSVRRRADLILLALARTEP